MEEVSRGPSGPFEALEVIRCGAGMSAARFCVLIDMPEPGVPARFLRIRNNYWWHVAPRRVRGLLLDV